MFGNILILFIYQTSILQTTKSTNPRVCVIGAGISGMSVARYLKAEGINFTVLEATRYVGGTWRYDPRVDIDENGLPLHTGMYRDLRTNLPKPAMELPGFPLPAGTPSHPSWEIYYPYLQSYAKHFDIEKYIKFLHNVILVRRVKNRWKVKYQHVVSKEEFEEEYDFVVVCTGHLSKPNMPIITGEQKFKGTIIHSHSYRVPEPYKCRRVLIVGAGPSGMDIALALTKISSRVFHSHHSFIKFRTPFPDNYVKKPDVKKLNETGAEFVDGTFEKIEDIIYCTGYEYDYPFLDESCNLTISKSSVTPLHKTMVNINQPTMIMMGLILRACLVIALDAQARYTTALIKDNFTLPTHDKMMAEWQRKLDSLRSQGRRMSEIHALGLNEDEYYEELTKESGIERVPPVMFRIRLRELRAVLENLFTYRQYSYKVLDRENYSRFWENSDENDTKEDSCELLDNYIDIKN